ncbi:MAG TPA: hypothetical protein VIV12_04310, partial [Streptosporangiaceae bacterium]
LCRACRRGLAADLRRLPSLHHSLEQALGTQRPGARGNGSGLPVNEPVADCRSQIRHDLTWWCRHVTAERGLGAPPVLTDGWATGPVLVMCEWLLGQVTWCSFRDWAGDMAGAMAADRGKAVALLQPFVVKRFAISGPDGMCLDCGQARLETTIYATRDDRRWSFFGCPACGARVTLDQWAAYERRLIERRKAREEGVA